MGSKQNLGNLGCILKELAFVFISTIGWDQNEI